jgi:hypothetical protein
MNRNELFNSDKFHAQMVQGYIVAMHWASTDYDDNSLENYELSQEGNEAAVIACARFIEANKDKLDIVLELHSWYNAEQAGHDLFLTRERHGAGFWDRGLGHYGDVFTKYCESIGPADPYVGDDNLVYMGE